MKCYILLCVGALVALAASKPTNKLNRNHSSLTVVSSAAVVSDSPDYAVDPSDLSRNFVPDNSVSNNHKRVRRTVLADGRKCSTGKIRVGNRCVSCALLQRQNPHACKNPNETFDSQTATQETLLQQWSSIASPNSDSDIIFISTSFNSDITTITTSSTIMTTVLDSRFTEASIIQSTSLSSNASSVLDSRFTEACIIQSTSLSSNASSNNYLASNCIYFITFVYLILYLYMTYDFI